MNDDYPGDSMQAWYTYTEVFNGTDLTAVLKKMEDWVENLDGEGGDSIVRSHTVNFVDELWWVTVVTQASTMPDPPVDHS